MITSIKYINMDKNFGKNWFMKHLLRGMSFEYERIPGVKYDQNCPDLSRHLINGVEPYLLNRSHSRVMGVIGCWIAHTNALQKIKEVDGITVVLEDDFICGPDFFALAQKKISEFKKEFDVIVFDPRGIGPLKHDFVESGIYKSNKRAHPYYVGTQCVFVNNSSVAKILAAKEQSPIKDYDGYLIAHDKINTYIFYTGKSQSVWFGSDIEGGNNIVTFIKGIIGWSLFKISNSNSMRNIFLKPKNKQ